MGEHLAQPGEPNENLQRLAYEGIHDLEVVDAEQANIYADGFLRHALREHMPSSELSPEHRCQLADELITTYMDAYLLRNSRLLLGKIRAAAAARLYLLGMTQEGVARSGLVPGFVPSDPLIFADGIAHHYQRIPYVYEVAIKDFFNALSQREQQKEVIPEPLQNVFLNNYGQLLGLAAHMTRTSARRGVDPEDVVHEALLRAAKAKQGQEITERPEQLLGYLKMTVRNLLRDQWKSKEYGTVAMSEPENLFHASEESAEEQAIMTERQQAIRTAIRVIFEQLQKRGKRTDLLYEAWVQQTPAAELAKKYGITPDAVKGTIFRARQLIDRMVEAGDIELPDDL